MTQEDRVLNRLLQDLNLEEWLELGEQSEEWEAHGSEKGMTLDDLGVHGGELW